MEESVDDADGETEVLSDGAELVVPVLACGSASIT
jgi:hypothetical protein